MLVNITFLGHSGFLIKSDDATIAIDPFLTHQPNAPMPAEDVECSGVAITHAHMDHFYDALPIAKKNDATIYAAFELAEYCSAQGHEKVEPLGIGGRVNTPFGFVALTQAFHSSSHDSDRGQYMGMPAGVIVNINDTTIYHCGDTGIFSDMKLIGELYQPDIAMIPIGDRFTMGPEHATLAAEMIKPKIAIPIHYNTWPPIEQDPGQFTPKGVEVKVMNPGDEITWG